jgi:hypothetical protein
MDYQLQVVTLSVSDMVSGIRHKSPAGAWQGGWAAGTDPERRDYASFADFTDPDGNTWVIQEIGYSSAERDD